MDIKLNSGYVRHVMNNNFYIKQVCNMKEYGAIRKAFLMESLRVLQCFWRQHAIPLGTNAVNF